MNKYLSLLLSQYDTLTEGEREVVYQRLVLNRKWAEISRSIGISKQRVSQLKEGAFKKLDLSVKEERRRSQWMHVACQYPSQEERKRRKIYQAKKKKLMEEKAKKKKLMEEKANEKTTAHKSQYKMSEVVHILSSEYPGGVQAGAIRFWEQEDILEPKRTKRGHRRYTKSDIDWIRLIKELSLSKMPVWKMRERVKQAKEILKNQKGTIKHCIKTFNKVNILDAELRLLYGLTKGERKAKIYDLPSVIDRLGIDKARMIVEKAEKYEFVVPSLRGGIKRINPYEKMILNVISFLELLSPGKIERCKTLPQAVQYLSKKVGIRRELVFDQEGSRNFGYNAVLYNLVYRNSEGLGMLDNPWGTKRTFRLEIN